MARTHRGAILLVLLAGALLVWRARPAGEEVAPSFAVPSERPPSLELVPGPDLVQRAEAAARVPGGPTPGQDEGGTNATADLRIRVVDDVGASLAGARVQVAPAEFPYLFRLAEDDPWREPEARPRGSTDDSGLLVLEDLPVRDVKIYVDLQARRGSTPEMTELIEGPNEVEVVLQRPGSLEVVVVREDGIPVPEVDVQATGWISARSDAAGVARFAELPPGRYRPRVPGLVQLSTERVEVRTREAARATVVVVDGGWIEGELRDADGESPAEAWIVDAVGGFEDEADDLTPHEVRPGARYRLGPLVPGRYRVVAQQGDLMFWASAPIHASPEVEVRAGTVTECSVVLASRAPTTLTGSVRAPRVDGAAPEIVVSARAADAPPIGDLAGPRATARAGTFELELPRPGTWRVTPAFVTRTGLPQLGETVLCEVDEAGAHVELGFGGYRVSGTVEPAGPFGIWALDGKTARGSLFPATFATESGAWSVQLEQPGPWWFVATGAGFWSARGGDPTAAYVGVPVRVELTEDELERDGVRLRANGDAGPFAALDVAVFDRDGLPVESGFQLRVRDAQFDLPFGLAAALEPGERTWFLRAIRGDECSAERALDLGALAPVRLDLGPGALLRVETTLGGRPSAARIRLRAADGRTIPTSEPQGLFATFAAHGNAPDRATFGPLLPGRYRVEATNREGARRVVPVELEAGWDVVVVKLD